MYASSKFDRLLEETPLNEWVVKEVFILDWYDGITCGVYEIEHPAVAFLATQIAYYDTDLVTERLFNIAEVPLGTVARIKQVRETPDISFEEQNSRIDTILQDSKEVALLFQSSSNDHFDRWWIKASR